MRAAAVSRLAMVVAMICVGLSGCYLGDITGPGPDNGTFTESEKREADAVALWLSGELSPPDSLSRIIAADLQAIRARFGYKYPFVKSLGFQPPWKPGRIEIHFSQRVCWEIEDGLYHDWDELNATFGMVETRMYPGPRAECTVYLYFDGVLHPDRLCEYYRPLRGVTRATPGSSAGDWPNIYPWETEGTRTYLFRNAWGDCPSGCIDNEYVYFKMTSLGPVAVGHYTDGQPPEWWQEARTGMDAYWSDAYGIGRKEERSVATQRPRSASPASRLSVQAP